MKKIYVKSRFCLREDTFENWIINNPVLERGEPSVVRNPEKEDEWLKIGDGVTDWVNLPYKKGPRGENGGSTIKIVTTTLYANLWVGSDNFYSQVVDIEGIPADYTGTVRLTPEQVKVFHGKDVAFMVGNENGIITVYLIGQLLMNDYDVDIKFEKEERI